VGGASVAPPFACKELRARWQTQRRRPSCCGPPNSTDKELIGRDNGDPIEERRHFPAVQARHLFALPAGESVLDYAVRC
jgi:hypothetical protein